MSLAAWSHQEHLLSHDPQIKLYVTLPRPETSAQHEQPAGEGLVPVPGFPAWLGWDLDAQVPDTFQHAVIACKLS